MIDKEKWTVQVPITDLLKIVDMLDGISMVTEENRRMRREIDGMRGLITEQNVAIGDLRRALRRFVDV